MEVIPERGVCPVGDNHRITKEALR
jgi:hypothetical protein